MVKVPVGYADGEVRFFRISLMYPKVETYGFISFPHLKWRCPKAAIVVLGLIRPSLSRLQNGAWARSLHDTILIFTRPLLPEHGPDSSQIGSPRCCTDRSRNNDFGMHLLRELRMRREINQLVPTTVQRYRSLARKLWAKVEAGTATEWEKNELQKLERQLGISGRDVRPPGRPRSTGE